MNTQTTHPTVAEVKMFLVDWNGWTEAEFDMFIKDNADHVNADGVTTNVTRDSWEWLAERWND